MTERRATDEELAEEARRWDSRELTPAGWEDATDAIPRAKASESISLRLPKAMLAILKEFARREGVGYQVLLKRWLDDRIRLERDRRTPPSAPRSTTAIVIADAAVELHECDACAQVDASCPPFAGRNAERSTAATHCRRDEHPESPNPVLPTTGS